MAVKKIAISVPEDVLERVDHLAKKLGTTRSAFISRFLKEISTISAKRDITERINNLFDDIELANEQSETSHMFVQSPGKKYGDTEW